MIINIRGTNGAGKSTVVQGVLTACAPAVPIFGLLGAKYPEAYALRGAPSWYVVGPYTTPTGGCDVVGSVDRVLALLVKYSKRGSIVFEGVTLSDCVGTVGEWLETQSGVVLAYMTTPLDVCAARVAARRQYAGNAVRFDPMKKLVPRQKYINNARAAFAGRAHVRAVDLSTDDPLGDVLALIRGPHAAQ